MPFLSPWGLLAALSLPAILLLYFLRQRHQEQVVPSTFLWARALQELEATRPWQKLRKNLLMLLQLLCALLLSLALARPFSPAAVAGEFVVVLDTSASMQATDGAPTRFAAVMDQLNGLIAGLRPGAAVTVIEAGSRAQVRVGRTTDKGALQSQIAGIKPGNHSAALGDALSLARALTRESEDAQILLYSDQGVDAQDIQWINCAGGGQNLAVRPLSYQRVETGLTVLSPIYNSGAARVATLECYIDGALFDARDVQLAENGVSPVYWDGITLEAATVEVRVADAQDALSLDDSAWTAIAARQSVRVLLVTEGNRFLEAALSLREGLVLEKTTPDEQIPSQGYDLYVMDGLLPQQLPEDGALLLVNPPKLPKGVAGKLEAAKDGGALAAFTGREGDAILSGVSPAEVRVAKANTFTEVTGFDPLMTMAGEPVIITGAIGRSPAVLIGFDVRDSDWPLKKDFPIFIQNTLQWAVPHADEGLEDVAAGDPVLLYALPQATGLAVTAPDGTRTVLAPPFPPQLYENALQLGLYTVTQTLPEGEVQSRFAVHLPLGESQLSGQSIRVSQGQQGQTGIVRGAAEYAPYLLMAALALLLLEWGVSTRGR